MTTTRELINNRLFAIGEDLKQRRADLARFENLVDTEQAAIQELEDEAAQHKEALAALPRSRAKKARR